MLRGISFSGARYKHLVRIAVDHHLSVVKRGACRRERLEVIRSQERAVVGKRHGAKLDDKELRGALGGERDE